MMHLVYVFLFYSYVLEALGNEKSNLSLSGLTLVMLNNRLNNLLYDTICVCLPIFISYKHACIYKQRCKQCWS